MPKLHVLVDKEGNVLGTFRADETGRGPEAPSLGFHVRPEQRLVEVELDEKLASLDPVELHKQIKARHLR